MNNTCDSCKFWEKHGGGSKSGWCQRLPPQVVVRRWSDGVMTNEPALEPDYLQSVWPMTESDEWCGEHQVS